MHFVNCSPSLFTGCGQLISSVGLAAIHQRAKKDCKRLFHALFEAFFTNEECHNAVVYGKHGVIPEGKKRLDTGKRDALFSKYSG